MRGCLLLPLGTRMLVLGLKGMMVPDKCRRGDAWRCAKVMAVKSPLWVC